MSESKLVTCIIVCIQIFQILVISAVYTGIKKPESFSHSGFSLKVARATSPKHSKKPESKNPPPQGDFLKLRRNFTGFLPM